MQIEHNGLTGLGYSNQISITVFMLPSSNVIYSVNMTHVMQFRVTLTCSLIRKKKKNSPQQCLPTKC